jgi:hypothetical protein
MIVRSAKNSLSKINDTPANDLLDNKKITKKQVLKAKFSGAESFFLNQLYFNLIKTYS